MTASKAVKRPAIGRSVREYRRGETVFTAGDTCDDVFYIQTGGVTLSTWSAAGLEAVVGTLGAGDFFGEECLKGQRTRLRSATAMTPSLIRAVGKVRMHQLLRMRRAVYRQFTANMLLRKLAIDEDLLPVAGSRKGS